MHRGLERGTSHGAGLATEDGAVTVRDRDAMTQERVPLEGVKRLIVDRLAAARATPAG